MENHTPHCDARSSSTIRRRRIVPNKLTKKKEKKRYIDLIPIPWLRLLATYISACRNIRTETCQERLCNPCRPSRSKAMHTDHQTCMQLLAREQKTISHMRMHKHKRITTSVVTGDRLRCRASSVTSKNLFTRHY